jgi:hypothetical protein
MEFAQNPRPVPVPAEDAQPQIGTAADPVKDIGSAPAVVARAFALTSSTSRARVLSRLLAAVGPLALAVLGGGAFVKYLRQGSLSGIAVSVEDAARATSSQVFELTRYVQQSSPEVVEQVLAMLARDSTTTAALGASVVAFAISRLLQRGGPPTEKQ